MTRAVLRRALVATYADVIRHHVLQMAAALSYYIVLSVFPGLILLSAIIGSIPSPDLLGRTLDLISHLLSVDAMRAVESVLLDVLPTNHKAWLSFGMLGTIWVASAAFDAIIEALDIAYDVKENRSFWKMRLRAMGLGAITTALVLLALAAMLLGPRFGTWLASRIYFPASLVQLWPVIHWTTAIAFMLAAVELMYYLAPNVRHPFRATLPGAIVAVACWIGLSYLLGFYFRHVANLSRTYGTLAGVIAFMTWCYWNSFALLVGAELNEELAKLNVDPSATSTNRADKLDHAA